MPVEITYPGVYIEETPSGVRTIMGVATSITAFMGRALCGPLGTDTIAPVTVFNFADYERIFGGLWTDSPMSYAVRDFFLNGGSQAVIVRLIEPTQAPGTAHVAAPTAMPDGYGCAVVDMDPPAPPPKTPPALPPPTPSKSSPVSPATPSLQLPLQAANPGSWGNWIRAMVDTNGIDPNGEQLYANYGVQQADLFNLTVFYQTPGGHIQSERFLNLTLGDYTGFPANPNRVDRVVNQQSQLVQIFADSFSAQPQSAWLQGWTAFSANSNLANYNQQQVFALLTPARGGDDGQPIQSALTYADPTTGGIAALDKVDLFNLLCVPYDTTVPGAEDAAMQAYPALTQYCLKRRAMFIIDSPSAWTDAARKNDFASIQPTDLKIEGDWERNAAVYFPRVVEADPLLKGQPRVMPACGIIAGVIARTDASRGIWKAPAGMDAGLNGILNLEVNLTDNQNGLLNPLAINCLRSFPTIGPVAWGARTLRGADQLEDDYKYIPVRRLTLYIEESLYRGTSWSVFEPNADPLWTALRAAVNTFLSNLQRQGAFYSYFVNCDSTTTTVADIASGVVNIIVGIAPVEPAEFIVIQIQQTAGQTS